MVKITLAAMLLSQFVFAHDGGHGPKLRDQPKYGGKVAAVIDKKEELAGAKAKILYKAELTKNNQNVVRVYLYSKDMKILQLEGYESANGELTFKDKRTRKKVMHEFALKKMPDASYEGKLPARPRRPYNIEVTLSGKERKLLTAFHGLN